MNSEYYLLNSQTNTMCNSEKKKIRRQNIQQIFQFEFGKVHCIILESH